MIFRLIFILLVIWGCFFFRVAQAIDCYQCNSDTDIECAEFFDETSRLKPLPCDHIHEARFCTKTTGMFGGKIGTVRGCSSRDLGNYCTYLDRSGDTRATRSCMYTCTRDGCNSAPSIGRPLSPLTALLLTMIVSLLGSTFFSIA